MGTDTGAVGVKTNALDLAALYLRQAGLPDNIITERMLAAWFMAESQRVGGSYIMVYNNNPLNIRPESSSQDYHHLYRINKDGTKRDLGKFASYGGTTAGAQAWNDFLTRNGYKGIITAFRHADPVALHSASAWLNSSGNAWGTSANTFYSVYTGLVASGAKGTGQNLDDGSQFNGINGSGSVGGYHGGNTGMFGLFYMNGKPIIYYPVGKPLDQQMITDIVNTLDSSGFVPSADPISRAAALSHIRRILMNHEGEPWGPTLGAELAAEISGSAIASGNQVSDAISAVIPNPLNDINKTLGDAVSKLTNSNDWFHLGMIVAGGVLFFLGLRITLKSVGQEEGDTGEEISETVTTEPESGGEGPITKVVQPKVSPRTGPKIVEEYPTAEHQSAEPVVEPVVQTPARSTTPRMKPLPKGVVEPQNAADNKWYRPVIGTRMRPVKGEARYVDVTDAPSGWGKNRKQPEAKFALVSTPHFVPVKEIVGLESKARKRVDSGRTGRPGFRLVTKGNPEGAAAMAMISKARKDMGLDND